MLTKLNELTDTRSYPCRIIKFSLFLSKKILLPKEGPEERRNKMKTYKELYKLFEKLGLIDSFDDLTLNYLEKNKYFCQNKI